MVPLHFLMKSINLNSSWVNVTVGILSPSGEQKEPAVAEVAAVAAVAEEVVVASSRATSSGHRSSSLSCLFLKKIKW